MLVGGGMSTFLALFVCGCDREGGGGGVWKEDWRMTGREKGG